jgi:hypothetical protein
MRDDESPLVGLKFDMWLPVFSTQVSVQLAS